MLRPDSFSIIQSYNDKKIKVADRKEKAMENEKNSGDFCFGRFDSSIDEVSRLRLNCGIIRQLSENDVAKLWIFPSPAVKAVILCPEQNRQRYMEYAQTQLPKVLDPEMARRIYIYANRIGKWDRQGRLYLSSAIMKCKGLKIFSEVILLGVGGWYELWDSKDWPSEAA